MPVRLLCLFVVVPLLAGCNWFRTRDNAGGDAETRRPAKLVSPEGDPLDANPGGGLDQRDIERNDRGGLLPINRPRPDDAPPTLDTSDEVEPVPGRSRVPDLSAATSGAGDDERTLPVAEGEAMPVGGIIARVNGEPVYTDAVLQAVRPVLRGRARVLDRERYRVAAIEEITQQVRTIIRDRLALERAQRRLDGREKLFTENLTTAWREEQIITAGGSRAVADQKARELGYESFNEMVERKYDQNLIEVFYDRKIRPRVQVTAAEMRRRYQQEQATRFSDKEVATFRLIRFDPEPASGGSDSAMAEAEQVRQRIVGGEIDFLDAASEFNDDPALAASQGALSSGSMERGTYRYTEVEDAVFDTPIGEVTQPIPVEAGSRTRYYLALVEDKSEGRTRGFTDPEVQTELRRLISQEKYQRLIVEEETEQQEAATVAEIPGGMETAIEIALNDYDVWTAEGETGAAGSTP